MREAGTLWTLRNRTKPPDSTGQRPLMSVQLKTTPVIKHEQTFTDRINSDEQREQLRDPQQLPVDLLSPHVL